jgi:IS5 family transposase
MLSLDTAYRSFGGEVEASSTPTICRLSDSRRHQLWAIAPTALREAVVIRTMLADLERTKQLLDGDIVAEEKRAQVFEKSDPLYSILARTLVERRNNLKATVNALEQRLKAIDATISPVIAAAA